MLGRPRSRQSAIRFQIFRIEFQFVLYIRRMKQSENQNGYTGQNMRRIVSWTELQFWNPIRITDRLKWVSRRYRVIVKKTVPGSTLDGTSRSQITWSFPHRSGEDSRRVINGARALQFEIRFELAAEFANATRSESTLHSGGAFALRDDRKVAKNEITDRSRRNAVINGIIPQRSTPPPRSIRLASGAHSRISRLGESGGLTASLHAN